MSSKQWPPSNQNVQQLFRFVLERNVGLPQGQKWSTVEHSEERPSYRALLRLAQGKTRKLHEETIEKFLSLFSEDKELQESWQAAILMAQRAIPSLDRLLKRLERADCRKFIGIGHSYLDLNASDVPAREESIEDHLPMGSIEPMIGGPAVFTTLAYQKVLRHHGYYETPTLISKHDTADSPFSILRRKLEAELCDKINFEDLDIPGYVAPYSIVLRHKNREQTVFTNAPENAALTTSAVVSKLNDMSDADVAPIYLAVRSESSFLDPFVSSSIALGVVFYEIGKSGPNHLGLQEETIRRVLENETYGLAIARFWSIRTALGEHVGIKRSKIFNSNYRRDKFEQFLKGKQLKTPLLVRDFRHSDNVENHYLTHIVHENGVVNLTRSIPRGPQDVDLAMQERLFDAALVFELCQYSGSDCATSAIDFVKKSVNSALDYVLTRERQDGATS